MLYHLAQCAALNLREDPADRLLGFQVQLICRRLQYKPPALAKLDAAIRIGTDALIALLLQAGEEGDCVRRIAPLHALLTKHQRAAVLRRHVDEEYPAKLRSVIFTLIAVLGGRCTDALAGTTGKGPRGTLQNRTLGNVSKPHASS